MQTHEAAPIALKAASAAIYGGSGMAVYFGLSPGEWQVIGILSGIVIGLAGLGVNIWFKSKHLQLAKGRMQFPEA